MTYADQNDKMVVPILGLLTSCWIGAARTTDPFVGHLAGRDAPPAQPTHPTSADQA